MWIRLLETRSPAATLLVRLAVGGVFLSEGIQKFIYPDALGAGRFVTIGIPFPVVTGPFVGTIELVCGALLLLGLVTRAAAFPLIIDMLVAVLSTKIPILLGHGFWGFAAPSASPGFWSMAHEARTDYAMLLGSLFLMIEGAGSCSLDAHLARRHHD
ncbi:MAG: DoxX family protein [Deltaproteobacteria bacterium]|nr:DoxX family protein [Deltaproteobacteria bacterium]MBP1774519.1 DoxX family protein [candidate division NC10 bacterium]